MKSKYFLDKTEIRDYKINGIKFKLEVNDKVFPPPLKSSILARNIKIYPREVVIDIGTGSGFLALLAAKSGGKVCATDISTNAIELAKKNFQSNNVKIELATCDYFGPFKKKFDVVIANLAQTVLPKNYRKVMGKELANTVYGGENGNEILLKFLDLAPRFMHRKTRLYINVYSVSNYKETIKKILKKFDAKLLEVDTEPVKEFVEDNIEMYSALNEQGKVSIFYDNKRKRWLAYQFAFELTLKKD